MSAAQLVTFEIKCVELCGETLLLVQYECILWTKVMTILKLSRSLWLG